MARHTFTPSCAVALLLLAGLAGAAAWSPDGRQLAFSYIGGPESIYLVNADGSDLRPLVVRKQRDFRPEWSPDGSHLVFTSVVDGRHVIMRVAADGNDLRQLSATDMAAGDPDYSPDGRYLLYFTDLPGARDLYRIDTRTGEATALTETAHFDEVSGRWAPDGQQVVFVGKADSDGAESDIWILDTATGERRNVTASRNSGEFHPDWSPDGSQLVFIRVSDGQFSVVVHDLRSGAEQMVADGRGYAVLDPHFSNDGSCLTFTRTDFAELGEGMPAIVRLALKDGTETQIARGLYLSQTDAAGN